MLKVSQLTRSFNTIGSTVTAVKDVSLSIADGTFASIVGQSGSGKSTLLALLGALDSPTSGSIELDGQDVTKIHWSKLNRYRSRTIGFVFQNYHLIPNLTARENVLLAMEFGGVPADHRQERANNLLKQVGLNEDKQHRKPGRLSGGEQQRVAIARALANHPQLILADEPTGNLDSETGKTVFRLLKDLARQDNVTIIIVTHDMALAKQTDVSFRLKDGAIVSS